MNPILNPLAAANLAASGVTFSSQLPKDCPYSIMPHTSCKADGNPVPLWQIRFVALLEHSHGVYFICGNKAYLPLPSFLVTKLLGRACQCHREAMPLASASVRPPEHASRSGTYPLFLALSSTTGLAAAATRATAGVQPQLTQGIRRRDGVGEGQETTT